MKKLNRIIALILVLSACMSVFCINTFAIDKTAGSKVTVTFTFSDAYGADGNIVYSNADLFSSIEVTSSGAAGQCTRDVFFLYGTQKTTLKVIVTATIKAGAAVGDSCKITLKNCEYAKDDSGTMVSVADKSQTVTVISDEPVNPGNNVDYSELKRQINIANSLTKTGYTQESWQKMQTALTKAKALLSNNSQTKVDEGAKNLADAIAALAKVDYSDLIAAIEEANTYLNSNELAALLDSLRSALDAAEAARSSGVQADIDAAAAAVRAALKALVDKYTELTTPAVKEVIVEKEVEVEPKGDYCNIPIHPVYLILLIISAAINLVFIALLVLYLVRRKKNSGDNTPLVDYHIGDDE